MHEICFTFSFGLDPFVELCGNLMEPGNFVELDARRVVELRHDLVKRETLPSVIDENVLRTFA